MLVKQKINHHKIFYDHTVVAIVELAPIGVAVLPWVPNRKNRQLDFPRNGIIVFPENREHQGVSQSNHHPFTVTIKEDFLSVVAEEIGLPEPERFITRGE